MKPLCIYCKEPLITKQRILYKRILYTCKNHNNTDVNCWLTPENINEICEITLYQIKQKTPAFRQGMNALT
jgi:hypothetical protein